MNTSCSVVPMMKTETIKPTVLSKTPADSEVRQPTDCDSQPQHQ